MSRPAEMVAHALTAHGIACRREGARISLDQSPLMFQAYARQHTQHPDSLVIQLDFGADSPALGGRTIWNCFAGWGVDEESAIQNGFSKYLLGPFHVLLAALGGHLCEEGNEEWNEHRDAQGRRWRICDSPLITQGFADPAGVPFKAPQDELTARFLSEASSGVHWVEAFFAFLNGTRSSMDVQLDGEPWAEGARVIENWDIEPGDGYKSGRYFFIALPD